MYSEVLFAEEEIKNQQTLINCLQEDMQKLLNYDSKFWIDVKDKLPDSFDTIIFYSKEADIGIYQGYYYKCLDMWTSFLYVIERKNVTHWMPLPEPPKK